MVMADPQVVARRPAGGLPAEPTPAPPVPTGGPRSTPEPSRSVHTARVVGLIVSAVSGPPTAEGRPGLVIRFFTPQGQLITEIRPGAPSYDEALRLALD